MEQSNHTEIIIKQYNTAQILYAFKVSSYHSQENENRDECETCFFKVLYVGPASKQFTKSLSELVYWEFGLKLRVV